MRKVLFIIFVCCLHYSCNPDGAESIEPEIPNPPSVVQLFFPHENSLCNEGTNLTPTSSTVLFEWSASEDTNSYTLVLKNLITGTIITRETVATEIAINIERATPFEWYVTSNSNFVTVTAQSAKWKFYNASEGVQSYAPFPAEAVSPEMAEVVETTATEITLEWSSSDIDNDIVSYDLYFGTNAVPGIYSSGLTETELNDVTITPNTIYYWKIITKDSKGNSSESDVFQFKIE